MRGIAVTFLISFVSLGVNDQLVGLGGRRGVYPAAALLMAAKRDWPGSSFAAAARRFALFPTVFWVCDGGVVSR